MEKKAQFQSLIMTLFVILLSAAILFGAYYGISKAFTSTVNSGTCRTSVELRSSDKFFGIAGSTAKVTVPLKCKTNYYCMAMGGTCPEGYEKINVNSEADIQKEIAIKMSDCWWQFGEGQLNFFSRSLTSETYCAFCSQIVFDSNVQKKYPQITGLNNYLKNNFAPNQNVTYWTYFTGIKNLGDQNIVNQGDSFLTSEKYAITYALLEKSYIKRVGIGGVAGGLTMIVMSPLAATGVGFGATVAAGTTVGALATSQITPLLDSLTSTPEDYYVQMALISMKASSVNNFGCTAIEGIA